MTRSLVIVAAAVLFGLFVHFISLLSVPLVADRDAYARIGTVLRTDDRFGVLVGADGSPVLPFLDPSFVHAACRFDLTSGPIRVRVPQLPAYFTVTFYDRLGRAFFVVNDRATVGGAIEALVEMEGDPNAEGRASIPGVARVTAPTERGFVLVRGAAPSEAQRERVEAIIANASCDLL